MTHDPFPLHTLGWDASWRAELSSGAAASATAAQPGRVLRADRGACTLISETGERRASYAPGLDPAPCVGDWVAWDPATGAVLTVLPRRGALRRANSTPGSSREQVLACNVDVVIVAEPLWPEPHLGRLERLVTLAWDGGATPVVALTKSDLLDGDEGADDGSAAAAARARAAAAAPGCEVLVVSAATGSGLAPLLAMLAPGVTVALLGPSGAGKSTLVNALAGHEVAATGDVRRDGKGRHTTVHRELVVLDSGACLLDTPGLRVVGLHGSVAATGDGGLAHAFPEIEALRQSCRFADCAHDSEPGCAVRAALDTGHLDERRWLSWRKLTREAAWMAERTDKRLAAEQRERRKVVQRQARQRGHR